MSNRIVPYLATYQPILSVPEAQSQEDKGAFGRNPCLKELSGIWHDLLCVQKEVKMIASIFNTTTLIGRQRKKR